MAKKKKKNKVNVLDKNVKGVEDTKQSITKKNGKVLTYLKVMRNDNVQKIYNFNI